MPIFPLESGLTFGDTFVLGGVTFIWTNDGSGAGYWKKREVTTIKLDAGDQEIVYSENGSVGGSSRLSYDYTNNKLKLTANPAQSNNYLIEITDKNGNKYNSIKPSGLFEGEVANGNINARVNGQWTTIPTPLSAFVQPSSPPTTGITLNSLWFEDDQRRWNYWNGSAWTRLYSFDYRLTSPPSLDQDASALYSKGDLVIFESGTGSGAQRELFAVTSGTDGSGIKYIPVGGYQFKRSLISKTPTSTNLNTIVAQDSSPGLTVDGNGVSDLAFEVRTGAGRSVYVEDNTGEQGRLVVDTSSGGTLNNRFYVNPTATQTCVYVRRGTAAVGGTFGLLIDNTEVTAGVAARGINITTNFSPSDTVNGTFLNGTVFESRYSNGDTLFNIHNDGRVYVNNASLSDDRSRIAAWGDFRSNIRPNGNSWTYQVYRADLPGGSTGYTTSDYFHRCLRGGSTQFAVRWDGTVLGKEYLTLSDLTTKENIQYLDTTKTNYTGLSAIKNLQTASFSYKDTPTVTTVGFIAQDVEKVIPKAVITSEEDSLKRMDLMPVVATLVNAIKELTARVEALEA